MSTRTTSSPPDNVTGRSGHPLRDSDAELQSVNQQLDLLASGLSHDLRAPLRAIHSFAGLLGRSAGERLVPAEKDYLQRIQRATDRMSALVDGLVEWSRVSTVELKPECVDLSLLAEWAAAELQETEPERAANIVVATGLVTHGDERLLKQLLVQLLQNAWRFSRDRDAVCIRVEGEAIEGGMRLSVHDQGRGIDMRYADKLFQPFQRLHGEGQGAGHGLGLATVQRIAQRHGGRVWAESEVGVGSVFHVELPDAGTPATNQPATGANARPP